MEAGELENEIRQEDVKFEWVTRLVASSSPSRLGISRGVREEGSSTSSR